MISQMFLTLSGKFAFQQVGEKYRLYNNTYDWIQDFHDFSSMCEYLALYDR